MTDFELVEFEPGDEAHARFVYDSFRSSTVGTAERPGCWPWNAIPPRVVMERLKRELAKPGTRVRIVKPLRHLHDGDRWCGWVAVRAPKTVVYAFTKYRYRRNGVATAACAELGIDFAAQPVGVTFWTPAAARIASRGDGFRLYHDLTEAFDE